MTSTWARLRTIFFFVGAMVGGRVRAEQAGFVAESDRPLMSDDGDVA